MMQSRICLIGPSPRSVVTLSNAVTDNNDIIVEQHRYPAGEIEASYHAHHVLAISSGPPVTLETCVDGSVQNKTVMPGDMCFYPQGVTFRKWWDQAVEVLHVGLSPAFVADVALQTTGSATMSLHPFRGTPDPQIRYLARALEAELQQGAGADRIYQESVGVALCVHLLRHHGGASSGPGRRTFELGRMAPKALRRALDHIHAHLDCDLSLADIAGVACLSPYHFSRAFKTSTGLSPHQYVLRARVEAAKQLLTAGDLSLSEIAFRVGFFDQSHLTRHFKRRYGVPPSTFVERSR